MTDSRSFAIARIMSKHTTEAVEVQRQSAGSYGRVQVAIERF